jgi:hypothetical protein
MPQLMDGSNFGRPLWGPSGGASTTNNGSTFWQGFSIFWSCNEVLQLIHHTSALGETARRVIDDVNRASYQDAGAAVVCITHSVMFHADGSSRMNEREPNPNP